MLIVVLFNLKEDASPDAYEQWARTTDIPTVNALGSVEKFAVFKTTGLLGSDAAPPYRYVELLDVGDMDAFGGDIADEKMQRIAAEFQAFADNPTFMLTESL